MIIVKTLEACKVAPPPISPANGAPVTLPVTHFDILWLNFPPTERVFFYEIPESVSSFTDSILPKLKNSLSLALHHFLPLAGNLVWPPDSDEPFLRVKPDAAVSLTVAETDADFVLLSGDEPRDSQEYNLLIPPLPALETEASVLALQVTVFQNRGFCIGIASHHAVTDGKTATMFIKAWASICRLGEEDSCPPPELTPFYNRGVIEDPKAAKALLLKDLLEFTKARTLKTLDMKPREGASRGTFVLTRADIENLREKSNHAASQSQNHRQVVGTRFSTFALTCAYAWACLKKAEEDLDKEEVYFTFTADFRSRLHPPIPETFFGNCLGFGFTKIGLAELKSEDGVGLAAAAISDAVGKLKEGGIPPEELFNLMKLFSTENPLSVAGSPQFGLYGVDFGWGRPAKVAVVSIDRSGAIGLAESRDGDGGVEVSIVLDKGKMEKFASLFTKPLPRFLLGKET